MFPSGKTKHYSQKTKISYNNCKNSNAEEIEVHVSITGFMNLVFGDWNWTFYYSIRAYQNLEVVHLGHFGRNINSLILTSLFLKWNKSLSHNHPYSTYRKKPSVRLKGIERKRIAEVLQNLQHVMNVWVEMALILEPCFKSKLFIAWYKTMVSRPMCTTHLTYGFLDAICLSGMPGYIDSNRLLNISYKPA